MKKNDNDNSVLLMMFGMLIIMAACPPLGVVLFLCVVFRMEQCPDLWVV